QFGAVVLSARRIADFTETQIRELRKFLRGPVPEAPIAPPEAPGSRSASEPTLSVGPTIEHFVPPPLRAEALPDPSGGDEQPGSKKIVLVQDADDEPQELLRSVTDTDDLLGVYLKQIGQYPLLSAAEEVEIAKRIEAGMYAKHVLSLGQYQTRR